MTFFSFLAFRENSYFSLKSRVVLCYYYIYKIVILRNQVLQKSISINIQIFSRKFSQNLVQMPHF